MFRPTRERDPLSRGALNVGEIRSLLLFIIVKNIGVRDEREALHILNYFERYRSFLIDIVAINLLIWRERVCYIISKRIDH